MSTVLSVHRHTFTDEVLMSPVPVVVDFYADWCGPCRMLAPILARLAQEFDGQLKFVKVNIDDEPSLADEFRVSSIPTLIVLNDGHETARSTGLVSEASLRAALIHLIQSSAVR